MTGFWSRLCRLTTFANDDIMDSEREYPSNTIIAVIMMYPDCHEVEYSWRKTTDVFFAIGYFFARPFCFAGERHDRFRVSNSRNSSSFYYNCHFSTSHKQWRQKEKV